MILIRAKTLKRGQKSGEVGEVWGGLGNLPDVFGEVANVPKWLSEQCPGTKNLYYFGLRYF